MYPFPADPQYLFDRSLLGHHEVIISPPLPSSSLFPLSPPTFSHDSLHDDLLLAHHLLPTNNASIMSTPPPVPSPPPSPPPPESSSSNKKAVTAPAKSFDGGVDVDRREKSLRKDRHSKIFTAQGPRDRRMRLSLDAARKFFDLQDILGFDKASKTVEWLLAKSKTAIKEAAACSRSRPSTRARAAGCCTGNGNAKSDSASTSECEVISTTSTASHDKDENILKSAAAAEAAGEVSVAPAKEKRAAIRAASRKTTPSSSLPPTIVRESRAMARARARERTREKKIMWSSSRRPSQLEEDGNNINRTPGNTGDESATHDMKSSSELLAEVEQPADRYMSSTVQENSDGSTGLPVIMITGESGPISIFDYDQNITVHSSDTTAEFTRDHWHMPESGNLEDQRVLLADDRFQTQPWEAFENSYI